MPHETIGHIWKLSCEALDDFSSSTSHAKAGMVLSSRNLGPIVSLLPLALGMATFIPFRSPVMRITALVDIICEVL